ncbi:APC family permease [Aneurinibacillus terranovensis]|uniref:APC family permease n=1 Tax=Aneurinibacillus terranovensis TaxID=278991 RepID=UPI00041C25C2|nr:APC family permease [Aneurinibacillus terranovensis]
MVENNVSLASNESSLSNSTIDISQFGYQQELKRTMNVWHLTAFGLNYMVPIAPAIIFGFLLQTSGGTVALPYLLAGLAMFLTALSYGVMVRNFPLAGSVYNYVGRGWSPHLGFIAGWTLTLDYILIPTVTAASSAIYAQQLFPGIPYWALLAFFSIGMGILNLFGVELLSKMGLWLLVIGEFVVWVSFIVWGKAVYNGMGTGTLISSEPFHFKDLSSLTAATSLAVFSYLGFDAITTLAEETNHPKRDIPKAIYWSVGVGALTMFLSGYFGMLVIPDWEKYISDNNWVNTTLFQVSKKTGGDLFSVFFTAGYLTELGVFNLVATAAGARLLYGMGRDTLLPKSIFAKINKRWHTPHWNIIIIVAIEFILGFSQSIDTLSNLVNYGALFGFGTLNLAVIWLYYVKKKGRSPLSEGDQANWKPTGWRNIRYLLIPILGFVTIVYVWLSMDHLALIIGTIWLILGTVFLAIKTKGFRKLPPHLDL